MLYRIIAFTILIFCQPWAAISWSIDASSGVYAEDSLVIQIRSEQALPPLGIVHSAFCATALLPALYQPIPGIAYAPKGTVHEDRWVIPGGMLPAGPLCLQLFNPKEESILDGAKSWERPSRERHRVLHSESRYPYRVEWHRPNGVLWTRVQIGTRNKSGSGEERILAAFLTQETSTSLAGTALAWIQPGNQYWIRLANAYDSSAQYVDAKSTTVFALPAHIDSIPAPKLLSPDDGVSFSKILSENVMNFSWQYECDSCLYQLAVFRNVNSKWIPIAQHQSSLHQLTLPISHWDAGRYQWVVSAIHPLRGMGQSQARTFQLEGSIPSHTVQVLWSGTPLNGATLRITPHGGSAEITARTGYQNGLAGIAHIQIPRGMSSIEISATGKIPQKTAIEFPSTPSDNPLVIRIDPGPQGLVSGMVYDQAGIPVPHMEIQFLHAYGEQHLAITGNEGQFQASLEFGQWAWKISGQDSGTFLLPKGTLHTLPPIRLSYRMVQIQGHSPPATEIEFRDKANHISAYSQADEFGFFQCQIPAGAYSLHARNNGYFPVQRNITLSQSQILDIPLEPGRALLFGSVRGMEELDIQNPQYFPISNADVIAWQDGMSDTIHTPSGPTGEFRIELPRNGNWNLCASKAGKNTDCMRRTVAQYSEVGPVELQMFYQARIEGKLTGIPHSVDPPVVWLKPSQGTALTVKAQKTVSQEWSYQFLDVKAGEYRIWTRLVGYVATDTPNVVLSASGRAETRGIYQAPPISFVISSTRFALHSRYHVFGVKSTSPAFAATDAISSTIVMDLPMDTAVASPDTLSMGSGLIEYSVLPANPQWIPLWKQSQTIQGALVVDTVLWPAAHSRPDSLHPGKGDTLRIKLELFEPTSSLALHILDGNAYRTLSPTLQYPDSVIFKFRLQSPGPILHYWFAVQSSTDGRTYSNPPPFQEFHAPIRWSALPFDLALNAKDTAYLFPNTPLRLRALAESRYGVQDYSAILRNLGSVKWSSSPSSGIAVRPDSTDPLAATITPQNIGTYRLTLRAQYKEFSDTISLILIVKQNVEGVFAIQSTLNPRAAFVPQEEVDLHAWITDSQARTYRVPASWSIHPSSAGEIREGNRLWIDSLFIGPLQIFAEYQSYRDTLSLAMQQRISPLSKARRLHHDSSTQIWIPDSAIQASTPLAIGLERFPSLSKVKYRHRGKDTLQSFYNIHFPQGNPQRMPLLAFRAAANTKRNPQPYLLDSLSATFQQIDSAWVDDTLDAPSWQWHAMTRKQSPPVYYGLLGEPDEAQEAILRFMPNPFSPHVTASIDGNSEPGTAIHFHPYYPGYQQVFVSLEILSLSGDPVRTLLKNKILEVQEHVLYWNGFTDSGHLVRNGRYIAILSIRKSANGKIVRQLAKPVVVFQ